MQKFYNGLTDKQKKIFHWAVIIVSLAVCDRLFFGPVWGKINMIKSDIEKQENVIETDLRILSYKDGIMNKKEVYSRFYNEVDKEEDDIKGDFLSRVTKLASKSNVNIIKSNPTEIKREENFIEYYANVDCVGSLKDMISFMYEMNSTDDLLKVNRFTMTPKRGTSSDVNASMTIVKMFIHPDMSNDVSAP